MSICSISCTITCHVSINITYLLTYLLTVTHLGNFELFKVTFDRAIHEYA